MLLDTCALLWLAHDQSKLSDDVLHRIEASAAVFISAVSGFEVALKCRAGKLRLPIPPRQWIDEISDHHRIDVIDLDLEISMSAVDLPPIHKDPCDRFIIATARTRNLPVVTADRRFVQYGVKVLS
jgi:PIN domain nuclease of toxin-antitoxin system